MCVRVWYVCMWLYVHKGRVNSLVWISNAHTVKSGGVSSHHCCDPSVESCGLAGIHHHGDHHQRCNGDEDHDLAPENGPIDQLQFRPLPAQEDRDTNLQWNLFPRPPVLVTTMESSMQYFNATTLKPFKILPWGGVYVDTMCTNLQITHTNKHTKLHSPFSTVCTNICGNLFCT